MVRKAKQAAKKTLIILSQDRDSPLPDCCEKTPGESGLLFWSEVAVVTALALLKKVWEERLWLPSCLEKDSGPFLSATTDNMTTGKGRHLCILQSVIIADGLESQVKMQDIYNLLVNLYPWLESKELVAAGAPRWGR